MAPPSAYKTGVMDDLESEPPGDDEAEATAASDAIGDVIIEGNFEKVELKHGGYKTRRIGVTHPPRDDKWPPWKTLV